MNFFERQEKARALSFRLVLLLLLGVTGIVVTINLFSMLVFGLSNLDRNYDSFDAFVSSIDPIQYWMVSGIVIVYILYSSLKQIRFLKSGGRVVAEAMGGKLVTYKSESLRLRQLLNIVEEMAIASGVPVPRVYLLEKELSINAFAAGYNLNDVVIGVTKGATDYLTREELQGVIAHEFSHILNGDMRHNMQLAGIVHGIQSIGILGTELVMLESNRYERHYGRRHTSKVPIPLTFFGLGLMFIGYTGTLFAKIIKSSFSRQREYLADASAVQFTRNNQGIAGALKKIGGYSRGSTIRNPRVSDFSHGMFADGLVNRFLDLLSTHPPLTKRIKALDPYWRETFKEVTTKSNIDADAIMGFSSGQQSNIVVEPSTVSDNYSDKEKRSNEQSPLIETVGQLRNQNLMAAKEVLTELPPIISQKMHTLRGAQAIIYSLFTVNTNSNHRVHTKQFEYIKANEPTIVYENMMLVFELVKEQDIAKRIPLIDICLPQLRSLSFSEYEQFKVTLNFLINADKKVELFEWAGRQLILNYLINEFEFVERPKTNITSMSAVHAQLESVMSMLLVNYVDTSKHMLVINNAKSVIGLHDLEMLPGNMLTTESYCRSVQTLKSLKPKLKEKAIRFFIFIVTQDKHFSIEEQETIRAICEVLEVPMPMQRV
jgi:Zn-dependent protease with chaperone function